MSETKRRVVVAMSGGVDSSVAAALLKQQGFEVIGMMLRLWSEPGQESYNRCCTPDSMALARRVAARLEIPFYAVDAKEVFYQSVVQFFMESYVSGETPNPCLRCNKHVRWEFLLGKALDLDADYMATGHYARLREDQAGNIQLMKAVDSLKDQSYVLHVLNQAQLKHALFPLGEYTKNQVRGFAREFNLPVADRRDSQDLCFLGNGDYREFLRRNSSVIITPGPILTIDEVQVGTHAGLPFYTIGQRKGLGFSSKSPMYVLEKDQTRNALIVGTSGQLGRLNLVAIEMNWVSGEPPKEPFRALVKIRYKAMDAPCLVTPLDGNQVSIKFDQKMRDITTGQAAVIYNGDILLGGGIIL